MKVAIAFGLLTLALIPAAVRPVDPVGGRLLRFVEGADAAAVPMPAQELTALNDPWAVLVLRKGVFPKTLADALAALDPPAGEAGYSAQKSFFVSESGQLPLAAKVAREFRMVVARSKPDENLPAVLVSAPAGSRDGFVELMSWDATKKAFNFYRRPTGGEWTWKGDTASAYSPAAAGKGCFKCHVHGTPIIKELARPWNNWHSQSAGIPAEAIPDVALRTAPLFTGKTGAEDLEPLVRGWVSTAIDERVRAVMRKEAIAEAKLLLRPLFETDTANVASSLQRGTGKSAKVDLPPGAFLYFDALANILGLEPLPNFSGLVDRTAYAAAVARYGFKLDDGAGFSRAGDTHFAFLVPVPSVSGTAVVRQLIAQKVVGRHFVTCVLMVDFPNPVYSPARAALLRYVPDAGHVQDGASDLGEKAAQAIAAAAPGTPADSPERQFVSHWDQKPDAFRDAAEKRIRAYQDAVLTRLRTKAGVDDYTRLAESRRRRFAATALNEFPLLLPRTNIPSDAPPLRMRPDGTVGE